MKDIYFKKLCTEKKTFSKVKNNKIKNFLIKADNIFVSGMSKVHNGITKWFDKISKKTVFSSYKKVNKQMDDFENVVNQLIKDLPDNEKQEIKKIFNEINTLRKYYTNNAIENRLNKQEGLMKSLETDFMKKYKKYIIKLKNDSNSRATTIDDNLEYWAESILNNNKDTLLTNNDQKVTALTSAYDKLLQKLTKLNPRDKHSLRNRINKIDKNLNSANEKECIKYFDKKRDLTLGGGPTDIVTSLGSIGLCGLSVASADNKEDRISKMLTTGFPLIAGVGASLAFTAMLFSGIQGMMLGFGSSIILSKIGSIINKHIFGKNIDEQNTKTNSTISNNPFIQQEEPNV